MTSARVLAHVRPGLPDSPARTGFTLLETMVAVVVLATAMVAVLSVCLNIQNARLRAVRAQAAALTLRDRLADMTAFGVNRLESRQGVQETAGGDWRWSVDVADSALPGLSLVTVTVAPDTSGEADEKPEPRLRVTSLSGRR
ncbi:type II secretion system minor pseudopilin GspI [Desulfovibrio sulfodismutans]|uniref:Type II secretion system protein I n=1 Tax=Desulfolutivibrio sulfodismutans TaxID=63561 RepID=A0A7K3NR10_9BACT|nr:type II secretion system minor pseudopilin GspI [Desulfolutivibrio sulfodismutans]NDY58537.1 type II secretion system minor pseudopilin GspI [Desulfolutivibrio sulfodismutans]QLA14128.1 type II secretion system protein GspI [Desulfolutivibrio sulfodismutans DSM 3696]